MKDVAVTLRPGVNVGLVASELSSKGLQIEQQLEAVGSITGRAAPEALAQLRTVQGVEDVSEIPAIQIAPPSSPIQ